MTNDHEEVCMRFYHEDLCPAFRNVLDGAGYFNRNLFLRLLGGGAAGPRHQYAYDQLSEKQINLVRQMARSPRYAKTLLLAHMAANDIKVGDRLAQKLLKLPPQFWLQITD